MYKGCSFELKTLFSRFVSLWSIEWRSRSGSREWTPSSYYLHFSRLRYKQYRRQYPNWSGCCQNPRRRFVLNTIPLYCIHFCHICLFRIIRLFSAPTEPPQDIKVKSAGPGELIVSWQVNILHIRFLFHFETILLLLIILVCRHLLKNLATGIYWAT